MTSQNTKSTLAYNAYCARMGITPNRDNRSTWEAGCAMERDSVREPVLYVPANFTTHHRSWREALNIAIATAKAKSDGADEVAYWEHELAAFDRSFARLHAGELKRPTPALRTTEPVKVVIDTLQELSQCDGSAENVANADVLAARVRVAATAALVELGKPETVDSIELICLRLDSRTLSQIQFDSRTQNLVLIAAGTGKFYTGSYDASGVTSLLGDELASKLFASPGSSESGWEYQLQGAYDLNSDKEEAPSAQELQDILFAEAERCGWDIHDLLKSISRALAKAPINALKPLMALAK